MAHVVLFDRLAFQRHKLDDDGNPTIEPDGKEEIVKRGHKVPDYVPEWTLTALTQSGMITWVADAPVPDPAPLVPVLPPGSVPPPGAASVVIPQADVSPGDAVPPAPAAPEPSAEAPDPRDSRAAWEEYATSPAVGMTNDEAASFPNKAALIEAVTRKTQ